MNAGRFLASVLVLIAASGGAAEAGPIKHSYTVVDGRDGYVYLRGHFGLHRVLDADGKNERVADTSECSGYTESHGVDARGWVPVAICSRASHIILAASKWHRHILTPVPTWPAAVRIQYRHRFDERYLTQVVTAADGGYWFAYGNASGLGRRWPNGQASLRDIGFGPIGSMAVDGDDVYVADWSCRIARFHRLMLAETRNYYCRSYYALSSFAVARDAVWIGAGSTGVVERRGRDGSHKRWTLSMIVSGLAIARDGTGYVLGYSGMTYAGHPMIAIIAPGRAPILAQLPMRAVGTIAVDRRDGFGSPTRSSMRPR